MNISFAINEMIATADSKALATYGPAGINVVPVSMIKINDEDIWLFDFFMNKTVQNIRTDADVTLTAWTGMIGVQIKAVASYVTSGETFDAAVAWAKIQNPKRVLKGLLVLSPTQIFDVSPGGKFEVDDLVI